MQQNQESLSLASRPDPDDIVILELLRSKSDFFLQAWQTIMDDRSHHLTSDTLQIFASFCLTCYLFTECIPNDLSQKVQDLLRNCQTLWNAMCEFMTSQEATFVQASLEVFSPFLADTASYDNQSIIWKSLSALLPPYSEILEKLRGSHQAGDTVPEDQMDLDDHLTSKGDHISIDQTLLALNRGSTPLIQDTTTFQRCLTVQIAFLLRMHKHDESMGAVAHSATIQYLAGLNEADLLSAQSIMPEIYHRCSTMGPDALLDILEDIGEKCLYSYEMERCEGAHIICIQMMAAFTSSWSGSRDHTLSESAMDMYSWFMDVLVARKRASPRVYIELSRLFQSVQSSNPSYGRSQSLASPRTSLFTILREGDIQVKFSVAEFIPGLFDQFSLEDHDTIFDDVLKSLPRDPDWIEGIALRLFVLSLLASKWHTLLRRSIYHLYQTSAHVSLSMGYAKKCMSSVSEALGLQNERQLFQLFASQILFTWTETQSVMSMPYTIFGYASLKQMLIDVKDEIIGQIMMRGKDSELEELASYIEEPALDILKSSFHKAEAYSISTDISTPPDQRSQPKGVEVRIGKLLGSSEYMTQIEGQFPQIVANFFKSVGHYDQIERAYSKLPAFRYSLDINSQIASKCSNSVTLPPNQQPSFRARYLLDELDFLCKRTGYEVDSMWTPTLASFVCRSLLETIHPALGSLHTCSVVRKIRILVCLAGPVMLQDYPLEMILHALRPLLNDWYCCEDVLAIFWYLVDAGTPYLKEAQAFMAGICIATFVTLRRALVSREMISPDGQVKGAFENIPKFHKWLCDFVQNCDSSNIEENMTTPFSLLLQLAQDYSVSSGSSKASVEKILVLELLKDQDSVRPLLTKSLCDLVLSLVCPEFENSFGKDESSSSINPNSDTHIVPLWNSLDKLDGGSAYRLWAARLIGRSFASSGKINDSLIREQDGLLFDSLLVHDSEDLFSNSKMKILHILCEKLPMDDHIEAGLIEHTLQTILNQIVDVPDLQSCAEIIPESLVKAFIWNPYICPRTELSALEIERCSNPTLTASGLSVEEWARNVSLYLSTAASEDPVIGSLRKILNVVPGLAVQLLPYVVHDVLLAENDKNGPIRKLVSECFQLVLREINGGTKLHAQGVINCVLYLRTQPVPQETAITERDMWLDIDFGDASSAAHQCGLQKTSLLFLEIQASRVVAVSRRSSVAKYEPPAELIHAVFTNIDDPDLFYGIQQSSSLANVMERLEYEGSGFKNLLFQSAQYDSEIQNSDSPDAFSVLRALNSTNLQGIANTMMSASGNAKEISTSFDSMLQAATSLQQWNVPVSPLDTSPSTTVYRAFQSLNTSGSLPEATKCIESCLLSTVNTLVGPRRSAIQIREKMRTLGIVTEISDVVLSTSAQEVEDEWERMMARGNWLKTER